MEIPKRKQNRLKEFDYSNPNAYFITICTNKRKSYFWKAIPSIENIPDDIQLSAYGSFVSQCICDIPKHYPMISVDHYVIMPNHIHLLLQINTDFNGRPMTAPTISMVVNQLKGAVSKQAGFSVWQKGFYDHVVRGKQDYWEIWNYIDGNPCKWTEDEFYY